MPWKMALWQLVLERQALLDWPYLDRLKGSENIVRNGKEMESVFNKFVVPYSKHSPKYGEGASAMIRKRQQSPQGRAAPYGLTSYDTASAPSRKPDLSQPKRQGKPKREPCTGP